MGFDYAVKLLNDNYFVDLLREVLDQLYRKRIDHAKLQDRISVWANFLHVVVAGGGGDDSDASVVIKEENDCGTKKDYGILLFVKEKKTTRMGFEPTLPRELT